MDNLFSPEIHSKIADRTTMKLDENNNIFITSNAVHSTDFDPGPATYHLPVFVGFYNFAFILKLSSAGEFKWVKGFAGTSEGLDLDIDIFNNILVAGLYTSQTLDLYLDTGTAIIYGDGGFFVKLNQWGEYLWGGSLTGSNTCEATNIAVSNNNEIYIAGNFKDTLDIDPSGNFIPIYTNSAFDEDIFLIKLGHCGTYSNTQSASACDTLFITDHQYTQSGLYFETYTDSAGCDSTIVLNITINPSFYNFSTITGCDSVIVNSQTYYSTGYYTQYHTSTFGCDSNYNLSYF